MQDEKSLTSIKIAAGKRTYFVDVKDTSNGGKYLKITESKLIENGQFERHGVMVFEEDLKRFAEALMTALLQFPSYNKPGDTSSKNN